MSRRGMCPESWLLDSAGGGHLLRVTSDHGEVGRRIAAFANEHHADDRDRHPHGHRDRPRSSMRISPTASSERLIVPCTSCHQDQTTGRCGLNNRPQDDDLDREWIRFGRDLCSRCRAGQRTDQCFSTHGRLEDAPEDATLRLSLLTHTLPLRASGCSGLFSWLPRSCSKPLLCISADFLSSSPS